MKKPKPKKVKHHAAGLELPKDFWRKLKHQTPIKLEPEVKLAELARARAMEVAQKFDASHAPKIKQGHLELGPTSYLALGDNEGIRCDRAKIEHARRYREIIQDAHDIKIRDLDKLISVMSERHCTVWEAYQANT
jgi:hypothetical protein